jgi:hypothetical protein
VEHWTGTHFEPAWLCQVGIEIHLGHHGNPCPSRGYGDVFAGPVGLDGDGAINECDDEDDEGSEVSVDEQEDPMEEIIGGYGLPQLQGQDVCVVVDKSGVHRLRVRPCLCSDKLPLDLQFLDMRLFPASLKRIQTVFSFAVLDDFRMDNLECKTAGRRYFNKLKRLTSNTFPHSVPVSSFYISLRLSLFKY